MTSSAFSVDSLPAQPHSQDAGCGPNVSFGSGIGSLFLNWLELCVDLKFDVVQRANHLAKAVRYPPCIPVLCYISPGALKVLGGTSSGSVAGCDRV